MKRLIFILLATSLTANAWLAIRTLRAESAVDPTTASHTSSAPPMPTVDAATVPVVAFESPDPAVWLDELRKSGGDDSTIRALIEGQLRQHYRAQLSALRVEQLQTTWWRNDTRKTGGDDTNLLKNVVLNPLREVLGRDPLDVQDAEKRFDFLPPAKRRLLAEIELDYAELGGAARGWVSSTTLKSDINRQDLLAEERRKDVMKALTPEERAEFDLRFEGSAGLLSGRLAVMNGTEREFRALRPLLDGTRVRSNALPKDEGFLPAFAELNQQELDKIAAAIGPERALDYQWSGPGLYAELVRFAADRALPSTTAARILQLAAETGVRASSIHHDAAIPAREKAAALQRLQVEVRRDFDRLVPESMRTDLPAQAVDWFAMLAEGRYMGFTPSLLSTGTGVTMATSVSTPARGRPWSLPPRPRALAK